MVKLLAFWDRVKSSYLFIPSIMSVAAMVLFGILIYLDHVLPSHWTKEWVLSGRPEGARDLISTVASAIITVGGVAFSVTIGAVAYSATQFGPRLLTNFLKDRGNQVALGTFISVFLFSVLVLMSIRGAEPADPGVFIPKLTILCNLLLVLVSLAMLIYFFNHVLESVHSFHVLGDVGRQFNRTVATLFPERIGEGGADEVEHEQEVELPTEFEAQARLLRAGKDGYVQAVDDQELFKLACRHELLLRLAHRPGDFVNAGRVIILAWPGDRVDDPLAGELVGNFVLGNQRTPYQDAMFLVRELIEFSARALSTGQNDPYTAINCINWLGSNLVSLAGRVTPDPRRFDEQRRLRVVAEPLTFDHLADTIFDSLRPYVKRDPNVSVHLMDMIRWVAPQLRTRRQRCILQGHAEALKSSCDEDLPGDRNHQMICDLYRAAVSMLENPGLFADAQPESVSRAGRQQG